jgi:hypothetical protein
MAKKSKVKFGKVFFNSGTAWTKDRFGEKIAVDSLDEANEIQSRCCGINCCDNTITLPINDANGTTTYPSTFEFVNVGGTIKLRVTTDLGAGTVVKEVSLA